MNGTSGAVEYTYRERRAVGISTTLGYFLDFYNLIIISFLLGPIQKSLGISLTQAGAITSATLIGSVAGGIFFGWLGDRIGRRPPLLWSLALFTAGAVLSAFAQNYDSLLTFRFLAGLGIGGEWAAGMVLFNEVLEPRRRGFGGALVMAMAPLGAAGASTVAIWALTTFSPEWGWRIALLTGGAPIFLMVYIRLAMPESKLWTQYDQMRRSGALPDEKRTEKASLLELFRGATCKYTILAVIVAGASFFGYQSITAFAPAVMIRELKASHFAVRDVMLMFAAFSFVGQLFAGWLSDVRGRKVAVFVPTIGAILGSLGMFAAGRMGFHFAGSIWAWPFFWAYMLWALGQSALAMLGVWFSELFPVELRSVGTATAFNVGRGIGAIAPLAVPMVAGAIGGSLLNGMMIGIGGSVALFVAAVFLPETAGRMFAVIERKERTAAEVAI